VSSGVHRYTHTKRLDTRVHKSLGVILPSSPDAARLATRLRGLRTSHGSKLTQADLARALSEESSVAVATISSWESLTNPKQPPADRLRSYALFFARTRGTDSTPHLPRQQDLTAGELEHFQALHRELLELRDAVRGTVDSPASGSVWSFESGPVTIICPEIPANGRSPLAKERNPNYTRTFRYADVDALIELWGQIRVSNPDLQVTHRLAAEVVPQEMRGHLVVLGGIAWNQVADRLHRELEDLPIQQVKVDDLRNGEIFRTRESDQREFRPRWKVYEDSSHEVDSAEQIAAERTQDAWHDGKPRELVEDVAFLARMRNPYSPHGTLTICSGVYSRGVLGAVLALTDDHVRERNAAYIANRFPSGVFAMLMRVAVVNGEPGAPDLDIAENRLYEWSPSEDVVQ
jgi:transcriptional regulator with XRE-family HTH domain